MRIARLANAPLIALILASCTSGSPPASASASADPSPPGQTGTPVASGTAPPSATAEPSPVPSPSAAAGRLPVPGFVTIDADALTVRQEPGLDGEPVIDGSACIDNPNPCERPFTLGADRGYLWAYVLEGPISADGYDWYLVATEMNTPQHASLYPEAVGWVAFGDDEDEWLVVDERSCPSEPIELADVTNLALTKLEMLHCLGDRELTLRGWLPALGSSEDDADLIAECRERLHWLNCGSLYDHLRPAEGSWAGNADYLDFVIDPASDLVAPERGQWVTVTGRFDHPDAESCGDAGTVLVCRFSFVLSAIEPG